MSGERQSVAVVTGSAQGIGKAIALTLAKAGWSVVVTDVQEELLTLTLAEITDLGGSGEMVTGDLRDANVITRVSKVADSLGEVRLLVNNAGVGETADFRDVDVTRWWDVIEVNLRGTFLMTHAVVPLMIESGGGRVVNLNSLVGAWGIGKMSAYSVSKAALMRLSSCLSDELHEQQILFFDLSPGTVKTAFSDRTLPFVSNELVTEYAQPELAANAILALASGRYDELSGRFLKSSDDFDSVLRAVATVKRGRQLRLVPLFDGDLP
jgi:3-oxoacyl-[acyl-carrier protein] reductase